MVQYRNENGYSEASIHIVSFHFVISCYSEASIHMISFKYCYQLVHRDTPVTLSYGQAWTWTLDLDLYFWTITITSNNKNIKLRTAGLVPFRSKIKIR